MSLSPGSAVVIPVHPMTPEERERLARLETNYQHISGKVDTMDGKLDQILTAAAMGKGAWWALLRFGGVLTLALGAGAWAYEHLLTRAPP